MTSIYANVCNAASTRKEVTLLFGTNQSWHSGGKEVVVKLSDCIILNPFTAKRLVGLLNAVVEQYEDRSASSTSNRTAATSIEHFGNFYAT
jgi:hypothetical protein